MFVEAFSLYDRKSSRLSGDKSNDRGPRRTPMPSVQLTSSAADSAVTLTAKNMLLTAC